VKKRNRFRRQRSHSSRRTALGFQGTVRQRRPKTRTFEQLEDRFCFSVSPVPNVQTISLSNDTPDGAAALWLRELEWAARQSSSLAALGPVQYVGSALPNDPMFPDQWHLLNTGQEVGNPDFQSIFGVAGEDINVVPAWDAGYTGEGVLIAVNDTGVQSTHPDLLANLHPSLRFNAITGTTNANPSLFDPAGFHGTAVAGLISATANNGIGGVGVAPGAIIAPVLMLGPAATNLTLPNAFNFATQNGIDITNNSWQAGIPRTALGMSPFETQTLRDSILFGRDGLGIIHVKATGNFGGPAFNTGFQSIGNWDSSVYDGYNNSRYVITVGGVDHDGQYANDDGTFTAYPEAGTNLLVVAPTGSNAALNIADDTGLGSGIWTTDLVGDFGANAEELPNGFDPDRDFLADPDYTSRFNGTSASSPIVAGVIALMLEANPNLTYRDVQDILVRSARQNAQFEIPSSGGSQGQLFERELLNTWQTNQIGPFRNPDPWFPLSGQSPVLSILDPIADPNKEAFFLGLPESFPLRAETSHYEPQPGLFTNGAGYTVSQGYGVYSELVGYGHGTIDAGLAVQIAEQWHTLSQNKAPERTLSTFVVQPEPQTGWAFPAAEKTDDPPDGIAMVVPGGIGGDNGFIEYWNEYFAEDDPMDPDDGPFSDYDGPAAASRGASYWQFSVPDDKAINVEYVEVKVSLEGPADDLDFIRINLTSPDGTVSELQHYYADPEVVAGVHSYQLVSTPPGDHNPPGDIGLGGDFVWTFSTNRSWGESTRTNYITNPLTGEPQMETDFTGQPLAPFKRSWELHMENWSSSDYVISAVEIVWHGTPIAANAQRVQGFVGIDTNSDEDFNYTRSNTVLFDNDLDPGVVRASELVNQPDLNQEPFAANILVEAFRIVDGVEEADPIARFLTGADGNYYFDLVPGDYVIRASDPQERVLLEDVDTDPMFLQHFKQEWRINEDWFFASKRDLPTITAVPPTDPALPAFSSYELGEIFYDAATDAPQKFEYMSQLSGMQNVPSGVKNLNFLIKQDAPPNAIVLNGTVYADLNGNGVFDGEDTGAGGIVLYQDVNRNGVRDSGEQTVVSSEDPNSPGIYTMTIFADHADTYAIGVVRPTVNWTFTNPSDGVHDIFAGPGTVLNNVDFFLDPPQGAIPDADPDEPGNILGVVFSDTNQNRVRDPGEVGVPGFRVYLDDNENGQFNAGEQFAITSNNGSYFIADVVPELRRIEIEIANEGTENAAWALTTPTAGYREVNVRPGETVSGQAFGISNRANRDWGDLPAGYTTRAGDPGGGPNHVIIPGFQLGTKIDGEVNGVPTPGADGDDAIGQDEDGIRILSNNGSLQVGPNVIEVEVVGVGGYLNGWIDINGDGDFDLGEQVLTDVDLNPGTRQVIVNLPVGTATGQLAARFRWGEGGLSFTGPAGIGEVEDYYLPSSIVPAVVLAGDYDLSGTVDDDDYRLWRSTFGTTDLRADGNDDGSVDMADYVVWRNNRGATSGTGTSTDNSLSLALLGLPVIVSPTTAGFSNPVASSLSTAVTKSSDGGLESDVASAEPPHAVSSLIDVIAIAAGSAPDNFVGRAAVVESADDSDLLLLDRAWAEIDSDDASTDDAVWSCDYSEDESVSDLALAAVFDDEAGWWARL
jgi:subtilisin family serine protease